MRLAIAACIALIAAAPAFASDEPQPVRHPELDAIAAAVIGGASLMGGEGTVTGALIGALVMAALDNGMSLMNLDITWQYVIKGLILLLAVWVDMAQRKATR